MDGFDSTVAVAKPPDRAGEVCSKPRTDLELGLLTGCQDKSYALGLALGLASHGVKVDVIGNDWVYSPQYEATPNLQFLNFGGIQPAAGGFLKKLLQLLGYYARLLRFITFTKARILHILWNGKLEYFDRTLLMLYGKLCGRKLVLTAHNTNKAKRDSEDSLQNRLTLRIQYHLADHIFVHTAKMKSELLEEFGVRDSAVGVIPFGLYNTLPDTQLTPAEAKHQLGVSSDERTILFFGRIVPYKGLEHALTALQALLVKNPKYRLIIAGEPMKGYEKYMSEITAQMDRPDTREHVTARLQFIPDEETELYLKAADVLVLPYKEIFQSGVLFVAFTFGLPVLAADVGSFREDVIEGKTGFVFKPGGAADLAKTIETYFQSDLYASLDRNRREIRKYFNERHSWDVVAGMVRNVYEELLK